MKTARMFSRVLEAQVGELAHEGLVGFSELTDIPWTLPLLLQQTLLSSIWTHKSVFFKNGFNLMPNIIL